DDSSEHGRGLTASPELHEAHGLVITRAVSFGGGRFAKPVERFGVPLDAKQRDAVGVGRRAGPRVGRGSPAGLEMMNGSGLGDDADREAGVDRAMTEIDVVALVIHAPLVETNGAEHAAANRHERAADIRVGTAFSVIEQTRRAQRIEPAGPAPVVPTA